MSGGYGFHAMMLFQGPMGEFAKPRGVASEHNPPSLLILQRLKDLGGDGVLLVLREFADPFHRIFEKPRHNCKPNRGNPSLQEVGAGIGGRWHTLMSTGQYVVSSSRRLRKNAVERLL